MLEVDEINYKTIVAPSAKPNKKKGKEAETWFLVFITKHEKPS